MGPADDILDVTTRTNKVLRSSNPLRESFGQSTDFAAGAVGSAAGAYVAGPLGSAGLGYHVDESDIGLYFGYAVYDYGYAPVYVPATKAARGAEKSLSDWIIWKSIGSKNYTQFNECFPAGTEISLADGTTKCIENTSICDIVAAFDGGDADGRGALGGKPVVRLFENTTGTWIRLDNGFTVTPGHHFLDARGGFRTIADILADDGQIVLEDGSIAAVTGEYVRYSAETADLYEQAEGYVTHTEGGLALAPVYTKGWKTYNFEVADYHTYVAGGVRVHNQSEWLTINKGDTLSEAILKGGSNLGNFVMPLSCRRWLQLILSAVCFMTSQSAAQAFDPIISCPSLATRIAQYPISVHFAIGDLDQLGLVDNSDIDKKDHKGIYYIYNIENISVIRNKTNLKIDKGHDKIAFVSACYKCDIDYAKKFNNIEYTKVVNNIITVDVVQFEFSLEDVEKMKYDFRDIMIQTIKYVRDNIPDVDKFAFYGNCDTEFLVK